MMVFSATREVVSRQSTKQELGRVTPLNPFGQSRHQAATSSSPKVTSSGAITDFVSQSLPTERAANTPEETMLSDHRQSQELSNGTNGAVSLFDTLGGGAESFRELVTPIFESIHTIGDVPQKHFDWLCAVGRAVDILEGRPLRHSARVAMLSALMAKALNLSSRDTSATIMAALLHDIGLFRIANDLAGHLPKSVSEKTLFQGHRLWQHNISQLPEGVVLSTATKRCLESHSAHGKELASQLVSQDVVEIIATNHESWNGTGYPLGLSQESIPMGARINALADAVDCLMTDVSGATARLENRASVYHRTTRFTLTPVHYLRPQGTQSTERLLRQRSTHSELI